MKPSLTKFLDLSWGERWLLAEATVFLLPGAAVAARVARWVPVRGEVDAAPGTVAEAREASPAVADVMRARSVARLVRAAARYGPLRGNCLERAVATKWALARRDIEAEIRVGVRREEGRIEAHAWVECGGVVVDDDPDIRLRFQPLPAALAARGRRVFGKG